jgi:hypothetical protein
VAGLDQQVGAGVGLGELSVCGFALVCRDSRIQIAHQRAIVGPQRMVADDLDANFSREIVQPVGQLRHELDACADRESRHEEHANRPSTAVRGDAGAGGETVEVDRVGDD